MHIQLGYQDHQEPAQRACQLVTLVSSYTSEVLRGPVIQLYTDYTEGQAGLHTQLLAINKYFQTLSYTIKDAICYCAFECN